MARTLADYLDIAEHAAGGQVDASIDLTALVNDAGRYLVQMHGWAFLQRPQALLDTVQDQAYLTLPTDFDKLKDVGNTDNNGEYDVKLVPADIFEQIKASDIADRLDSYLSLEWPAQTSVTANAGTPRLAIYPTPSASEVGRYWLSYLAGWVELSSNTDVANIPEGVEHLLVSLIRAYVLGETSGQGPYEQLEQIERSTMVRHMKQSFGLVNPTPLPMRGGAAENLSHAHHSRRHSTITTLTP